MSKNLIKNNLKGTIEISDAGIFIILARDIEFESESVLVNANNKY